MNGNGGYIYAVAALLSGKNLLVRIKYATGLKP